MQAASSTTAQATAGQTTGSLQVQVGQPLASFCAGVRKSETARSKSYPHLEAVLALSCALNKGALDGAISDLPLAHAAIVDAVADASSGHAVRAEDGSEGGLRAARLTGDKVSRGRFASKEMRT